MTPANGPDRSEVVVDALLSLLKIVVIDLEDNDNAQVIFEVLNRRQTPLSASDLVKNLLFLRAELHDEGELEQTYESHWAYFDDEWWRKVIGTGHATRGRSRRAAFRLVDNCKPLRSKCRPSLGRSAQLPRGE